LDHVPWRWSKKYHTIDFISYAIIFFIDQGIQLFLQTITWELDKLHEIHISLWITIHQASSNNSIAECQNYMSDILQRARRSGQWWSKCMRLDRKGVAVDHMKYVYITYFIEIKLTHVFLWLKLRVTTTRCCSLLPSIAVFYAVLLLSFPSSRSVFSWLLVQLLLSLMLAWLSGCLSFSLILSVSLFFLSS
jgi:hypothetical protein